MRTDLTGTRQHPVDGKGRVSLPAIHRKPLSDQSLVIVKSNDSNFPHLRLFALEDYLMFVDRYFEGLGGFNTASLDHQQRLTAMMRGSIQVKIDKSYRISLDFDLMKYAGITDTAIFTGALDHVEIFSPEIDTKYDNVLLY
jgi:DNA-binding transcriptional regulator/RsmH inhibitor MraZ